jgi:hypothetical protein
MVVSALVVLFTVLPVPQSLRYYLRYWGESNKEYAEVISRVRTLPGRVLSPEDPTITLYARGEINRSIFVEDDAVGGSSKIPQFLLNEFSQADYIVHAKDWGGTSEVIHSTDLEDLGFRLTWNNDYYAIWKNFGIKYP